MGQLFHTPRGRSHGAVLVTLGVAAAVFLILELDGPFTGVIKVPSASVRYTLQNLGQ